ncbi:MAG: FKBP-type peptidyl-prolyl cis-trans isomerase [Alphaproteobacteria bacterium]|nr:FKBP-type peptidyl-prolyl cis-trans isomerase [Alphaproteobacteria bacterium]
MRNFASVVFIFALASVAAAAQSQSLSPEANTNYLRANATKPGVISLPGIQYRVIRSGKGAQPGLRDCATVNYKGSLIDGKQFDATKPGKPANFPVGGLIAGWTEALQLMHQGDDWQIVIPAGLAYGRRGAGDGLIPPDQTLVFEVELVRVAPSAGGRCD